MFLAACGRIEDVGKRPDFTPSDTAAEVQAMAFPARPEASFGDRNDRASLWSGGRGSLLGDRRAGVQGDILTVVIEIDDSAEIPATRPSPTRRTSTPTAAATVRARSAVMNRLS